MPAPLRTACATILCVVGTLVTVALGSGAFCIGMLLAMMTPRSRRPGNS